MEPSEVQRAVEAARSTASAWGLRVDDAAVVHNSNRIAVRLTPCGVLARVAPLEYQTVDDDLEVVVARRLAEAGSPVAEPEPRVEPSVHARDGFAVTLWTYYEPQALSDIGPAEYANGHRPHPPLTPAAANELRALGLAKLRGSGPAPARTALGLHLDASVESDVQTWAGA